ENAELRNDLGDALVESMRPRDRRGDAPRAAVDDPRLAVRLDEERREGPRRLAETAPPRGEEPADGGVRGGRVIDPERGHHRHRDRACVEVLRAGTRPAPEGPGGVRGPAVPEVHVD